MILANTPSWVIDGRNWFGLVAAIFTALAGVWKWPIGPWWRRLEQARRHEIEAYLDPVRDSVSAIESALSQGGKRFDRIDDRIDRLSDAVAGVNVRMTAIERSTGQLQQATGSLHTDLRAHMGHEDTTDARVTHLEAAIEATKGDGR